ncbi:MAG: flagellar hook basal-body protein [Desulfarculus sp.]|nr:flagellar hook basal-body protein [Desulfarculus sp.]
MAIEGISATVSALGVLQKRSANSAHNLANLSTRGFVPRRVDQADSASSGVHVTGTSALSAGPILSSERSLDLALDGGGWFVLNDGQGGQVYTRNGNFSVSADGLLVDAQGRALQPAINIPPQTTSISVSPQGVVQALGADGQVLAQGQIQLASFANPGGLTALGGGVYAASPASGPPVVVAPGVAGTGQIVSGAYQASGTDLAREMIEQILVEREFGANLKALRTQDEMVGTILDVMG